MPLFDLVSPSNTGETSTQTKHAAAKPPEITESEHHILTCDGWQSRTIVCGPATPKSSKSSPLIVLSFGRGHCIGFPELELSFAPTLATTYNAIVLLPDYRHAPEFKFPYSVHDCWDTLQHIASGAQSPKTSNLLPDFTDAASGFIVCGTSAGANITSAITHLARDNKLSPRITGQALFAGGWVHHNNVPENFKDTYRSREQNKNAPILDMDLLNVFVEAHKPDMSSPLWGSFDQKHPEDLPGEVKMGHMGLSTTYFQVCGMNMLRDDTLIFERVLREECGVKTRVDGYWEWPHCWWNMWPKAEMSKVREKETVKGVGWLLETGRDNRS